MRSEIAQMVEQMLCKLIYKGSWHKIMVRESFFQDESLTGFEPRVASLRTYKNMTIWWCPNVLEWCDSIASSTLDKWCPSSWSVVMAIANDIVKFSPKVPTYDLKWALLPSMLLTFTLLRAIMLILNHKLLLFVLKTPKKAPYKWQ